MPHTRICPTRKDSEMNNPNAPAPGAEPSEPPPPYTENVAGAPPRHTNDIPLPDSPITTHNPSAFPPPQQSQHQPQRSGSSAAQYFASRPNRSVQTIAIPLLPNSVRADFYYPRDWAPNHDVSLRDWSTFVGFLVPDDSIRPDEKRLSPERRQAAEAVVHEWNDGFFLQRGIRVTIDDGTGQPQAMPSRGSSSAGSSSFRPQQQRQHGAPEPFSSTSSAYNHHSTPSYNHRPQSVSSSHHGPPGSTRDRLSRRLKDFAQEKDITASSQEGIRMSDKFSLSMGGLKVGKFNLDERGMNYGGKPIGPTLPVAQHGHHGPMPQGVQGGYPPPESFGRGRGYGPPPQGGRGGPHFGAGPPMGQPNPPQGQFAPPSGPPPPGQHPQQQTGTM